MRGGNEPPEPKPRKRPGLPPGSVVPWAARAGRIGAQRSPWRMGIPGAKIPARTVQPGELLHWWSYGNASQTNCGQPGKSTVYPSPGETKITCPSCLAEIARQNGCKPNEVYKV